MLVVEGGLRCVITPQAAATWAYETAKDYTERYNSRYGTGLIPDSLPMLDDTVRFWIERSQTATSPQRD